MKSISYSLIAAAAAVGMAYGQATTANTTPVGYETISLQTGFNYVGLRLHQSIVTSGTLNTIGTAAVSDAEGSFASIAANPTKMYILELADGTGVSSEFLGSAVNGTTINLVDNLVAKGVQAGAAYSIRPVATISSVFGAANSAGLATGFFGPTGADVIFVVNGSGFDRFYYDTGYSSWRNAAGSGTSVSGDSVPLNYADGLIVSSSGTGNTKLTISGEVKKTATNLRLIPGFNYVSIVAPAGATLAAAFGATSPANLDPGFFGPTGADVVFVPNGANFDRYYYDTGYASWRNAGTNTSVNPTQISLPSGIIISNTGVATDVIANTPQGYSGL